MTGVGRRAGIGAAIVDKLARDAWDIGFTYWRPYDDRMQRTPLGRSAVPGDAAELVAFLCSERGGWINGQVMYSDGGFNAAR